MALRDPTRNNGEMQQALTTPLLKSVVLGTLLLSAGALYAAKTSPPPTHRLVLHAVEQPGAVYLSEWKQGEVTAAFAIGEAQPIVFRSTADMYDGCRWRATETLIPIDDRTFAYDYSEVILSCSDGTRVSPLLVPSPRTGIVTVE